MSTVGPSDERLESIYERLEELDPNTFEVRGPPRSGIVRPLTETLFPDCRRVQRRCCTAWGLRRSRWKSARVICREVGACALRLRAHSLPRPRYCCWCVALSRPAVYAGS